MSKTSDFFATWSNMVDITNFPPEELVSELKSKSNMPPHERFSIIQQSMTNISRDERTVHRLFAGPWISMLHSILDDPKFDLKQLSFKLYRDEYVDDMECTLGKKGWWLRKRYTDVHKPPEYTLKCKVNVETDGTITYESIQGAEEIKKRHLDVEFLSVEFCKRIAIFDFLRISYNNNNVISAIDITRIDLKLYYMVAKCTIVAFDSPDIPAFPVVPRSKVAEALFHQNKEYYQQLQDLKILEPHNFHDLDACQLYSYPYLQKMFEEFALSFCLPKDYDPMEEPWAYAAEDNQ